MASAIANGGLLGSCPDCETPLHDYDVVIEYKRRDGQRAVWADCPDCRDVVHPDR
jgi:hypothetical protein